MSRTRLIKPAFFKHAELYEAERTSGLPLRLAFAALWTVADREGRFRWKSDLKPDLLPYDPVDILDVLAALERFGFVKSYEVGGKRFGVIPSFREHQTFHKTERASTIPAPLKNGEPTVNYTADTGAVTGAVAVTETVVGGEVAGVVMGAVSEYALHCTIVANKAVAKKWGEQTRPYIATGGQSFELAQDLVDAGVPLDVAKSSIVAQVEHSGRTSPPSSMKWFLNGIRDAHRLAQQESRAPTVSLPRAVADGADDAFDRAVDLARRPIQSAPAEEIRALYSDPRIKAGLAKIGGLPGIRETKAEKLVWAKKDFVAAYRAAGESAA